MKEVMILITGAAGKTGGAIIRKLMKKGHPIRALVRDARQAERLRGSGVQETFAGDMRDVGTLKKAADGVRAIYHICPNLSEAELSIGQGVIAAARYADVERLVYHSVLHPQTEAMPHHWLKMKVEAALFEAGLAFTILQPAAYMQNVLAGWKEIEEQGVYVIPYAVDTHLGMVDLMDVAEAAAQVLTTSGHEGAIYELAGPEVLTQIEVAAQLSAHLGRPILAKQLPLEKWVQQARDAGLGEYQMDSLLKMFSYYENFGFWGNPRVLSGLIGRPPTNFAAFLRRTKQDMAR
jgi:uncharacterized protein YbjT (DUF2867 family)